MTSSFPISSTPLSTGTPASSPTPPTPDVFPSIVIGSNNVKVRFFEPSAPLAINARWRGMPVGVYLGFIPSVSSNPNIVTLSPDTDHGFSLLKVVSNVENVMVDIFTSDVVNLDFTGHVTYPVYVLASAKYEQDRLTTATIFTRAQPSTGDKEVSICKIDKVNDTLVIDTTVPDNRLPPLAATGQVVGFMPTDSINLINNAVTATSEVLAARVSPYTAPSGGTPGVTPFDSLKDRIDADLSGTEIANRLGLRSVAILSNVHSAVSSSVNVSSSFSDSDREFSPNILIEPNGSETSEGAVTSPSDNERNKCFVVDADTGYRLVDSASGLPVFGSLAYTNGTVGATAIIQFVNASKDIFGSNNPFSAITEGDILRGPPEPDNPSGKFYEVEQIIDPNTAKIKTAFSGQSASVTNTEFRRFTLSLLTATGNTATLAQPTNIRFTIPAFFRVDRPIFDAFLYLRKLGELPAIGNATNTEFGKGLLAVDNAKVGSIRTIKDANSVIGNDFHTLNFVYGGAVQSPGRPGVVDVSVIGPTGPAGDDQPQGPQGPPGNPGNGLSTLVPFVVSAFSPTPPPAVFSFTHDFSTDGLTSIAHLWGGYAGYGTITAGIEERITVFQVTGTTGRIDVSFNPSGVGLTSVKLYLGACE